MAYPSKEEFQELIDFCQQDRTPGLIIDINNLENSIDALFLELLAVRKKTFKEMLLLPAYQWLSIKNKATFDQAIGIVINPVTDADFMRKAWLFIILEIYRYNAKHLDLELQKKHLNGSICFASFDIQKQEKITAKIAECCMDYIYPPPELSPVDFKSELKQIIKDLKKAKASEARFKKYKGLFYCVDIYEDKTDTLQKKIDLYSDILNKDIFPVKQINNKHLIRLLIISITQYLLRQNAFSKTKGKTLYDFSQILDFITQLLSLECFLEVSMSEGSIRDTINKEFERRDKDITLYKTHQSSTNKP